MSKQPLMHVVGAGGGVGTTTLATLLGACADEMHYEHVLAPRPDEVSPWVIVLTSESVDQAQRAVWLRDEALANGWRVAAIATRGVEKKRPKAVQARFIPISEDEIDTFIARVPYWPQVPQIPLAELPRWDFTRWEKKGKRQDGMPKNFAALFTEFVDYVATETVESDMLANAA